jgi:hypothetical protein
VAKKGDSKRTGKSRGSGGTKRAAANRGGSRSAADRQRDPFAVDGLVRAALNAAGELLTIDDPLEAEDWASGMLGAFYKLPAPFDVRERLERSLGPAIVQGAERKRNATGLAVLCALASVTGDEIGAREAAARMAARGVPRPRWAEVIGTPEFLGGYTVTDPFGDQIGYYLTFRYADREPHLLMALYDENLGGIIKDAFVAGLREGADPRLLLATDPEVAVQDADPAEAATRVGHAIATGDLFVDNDWTADFKHTRALLRARVRLLPTVELSEPPEPLDDEGRELLIEEFLASPFAPPRDETVRIVDHCLIARCDFGDGDPLRWSPTVVELFMLDYLPRKVSLSPEEVDALPEVLTAWVRFALTKRGLDERFVAEAAEAVQTFTEEFRGAVSDSDNFGPAKAIMRALQADGIDVTDQKAVDAWLADFNARPEEERHRFFGRTDDF